jgi:hypothetical protein
MVFVDVGTTTGMVFMIVGTATAILELNNISGWDLGGSFLIHVGEYFRIFRHDGIDLVTGK